MKQLMYGLCGAFFMLSVVGQAFSQTVIGAQGSTDQTVHIDLSWTLGELAVSSMQSGKHFVTEGFHQPHLKVEQITQRDHSLELEAISASVFPNPTAASLHIQLPEAQIEPLQLVLTDLQGQVIQTEQLPAATDLYRMRLSGLPSGTYFLEIRRKDPLAKTVFKIVKMD